MKKRLAALLCALACAMNCQIFAAGASVGEYYDDVSADHFYQEGIVYTREKGIMNGTAARAFQPGATLTRAQIAALLYRMEGSPESTPTGRFADVPADAWCAGAVYWALSQGIVYGTSESTFSPGQSITREQLATMIYRYIQAKDVKVQEATQFRLGYKDDWYVGSYAEDAVGFAQVTAMMSGDSQYNFNPKEPVSRAEAADVFMRLDRLLQGGQLSPRYYPVQADYSNLSAEEKNALALAVAQRIAWSIPQEGTDLQRVSMAAQIVSHYCAYCSYTMEGKDYRLPFGVFIKGEYSCAGATRALGMVLDCMGYRWTHVNENQYSHQWCEVEMDGQKGYADGQLGIAGYGAHAFA